MKRKKLLPGILLSAVMATQAVVPVLAADQGGFTVDLDTKTGIIRVAVPTTLAIAVDQFEQSGQSQIYSGQFDITNKSNVAVKIVVDSTVTVNGDVELVATRAKVSESTDKKGDAWLGVAALTAASSYDDSKTADKTETLATLTDANANVASFDTASKKASQTFYLAAGTGTDASLKVMNVNTDKDNVLSYAQFYKLTEETTIAPDADDTNNATEEDVRLKALVADHDVYVVATDDLTDDTKDQAALDVTVIAKGTDPTTVSWNGGKTYYKVADDVTATDDVTANTQYLYKEMADGGKAGFSYIGKLSSDKETWTKADISHIAIAYTITGVTGPNYQELVSALTYGLYAAPVAVDPVALVSGKDNTDVVLKVTLPAGKTLATNFASVNGVDASGWGSFASNFTFDSTNSTVTVKAGVFGFNSIKGATTDHKYTIVVKDTDGAEYSTSELNLAP